MRFLMVLSGQHSHVSINIMEVSAKKMTLIGVFMIEELVIIPGKLIFFFASLSKTRRENETPQ